MGLPIHQVLRLPSAAAPPPSHHHIEALKEVSKLSAYVLQNEGIKGYRVCKSIRNRMTRIITCGEMYPSLTQGVAQTDQTQETDILRITLLGTNISPQNGILSRWVSELPQVGYVNSLEGIEYYPFQIPFKYDHFCFFFHLKSKPGQIKNTPASSLHWIPGVSWRNGEVKPRNPPMALMYIYRVGAGMTRGLPLAWWHNFLASTMMPIGVFCMPFVGVQFRNYFFFRLF